MEHQDKNTKEHTTDRFRDYRSVALLAVSGYAIRHAGFLPIVMRPELEQPAYFPVIFFENRKTYENYAKSGRVPSRI